VKLTQIVLAFLSSAWNRNKHCIYVVDYSI